MDSLRACVGPALLQLDGADSEGREQALHHDVDRVSQGRAGHQGSAARAQGAEPEGDAAHAAPAEASGPHEGRPDRAGGSASARLKLN